VKSKSVSSYFSWLSIKSFRDNRLYKGLGFKVQERGNVIYISSIYKYKAISSRANKGRESNSISIL
jgi:hypothetical protein